jgi:hypothetical protein
MGTPHLPTPPLRSARRGYSAESVRPPHPGATSRTTAQTTRHPTHPAPQRKDSSLTGEIQNLLGGNARPPALPLKAGRATSSLRTKTQGAKTDNTFQASWLAQPPDHTFSAPQSARSGSVYLPVTMPKDRPMIPPGGLAPAPPPKVKLKSANVGITASSSANTGAGVSGAAGGKWADRLRSRK